MPAGQHSRLRQRFGPRLHLGPQAVPRTARDGEDLLDEREDHDAPLASPPGEGSGILPPIGYLKPYRVGSETRHNARSRVHGAPDES